MLSSCEVPCDALPELTSIDGERLGGVDHDRAAARKRNRPLVDALDLRLEVEAGEQGHALRVAHQSRLGARHRGVHVGLGLLEHGVVVDEHLVDRAVEEVAQRLHDEVLVGVQQARALALRRLCLHPLPQAQQCGEVGLEGRLGLAEGVGAQDDAAPLRHLELVGLLAHRGSGLLVLDLARDAAGVLERRQHEVAAGEAQVRRDRGPLGAHRVLRDLDEHAAAALEDAVDARRGVAGGRRAVVGLRHDVMRGEHPVALGAEIHERRVQGGVDVRHDPAVDVAAGQAGFGHRDLVGVECVLVHDRDAHLFGALRVDEHLAAQAVSNPRPAALASTPLSGAAPGRPWGGRGSRFKG